MTAWLVVCPEAILNTITRKEEKALKIKEEATHSWREENDIPNTECLLELVQAKGIQKQPDQTQLPQLYLTAVFIHL